MPTPITVTVNFIDLTGATVVGYMEAAIVSPSGVYDLYVAGTGMIAPKTTFSGQGTSVSVSIWGNDVVVDAADGANDTYYTVNLFKASDNTLIWSAAYLFTGAGPINLVGYPVLNPVPAPVPPTFPVVQPPGGNSGDVQYNNGGVFAGDGGFTFNSVTKAVGGASGLYLNPVLETAPVLTVGNGGTPGSTSYTYVVFAVKGNLAVAPSLETTTSTGNAALSSSNFNTLSWTAVPGATGYDVYRTASSGTPGTVGTLIANTSLLSFKDTGISVLNSNAPIPFPGFGWSQNGYVGIQKGLQVGVPWTTLPTVSFPLAASGQLFNNVTTGFTAQINTVTDINATSNYIQGGLGISVDAYSNYLTNNGGSYGLVVNFLERASSTAPSNSGFGIQSNLTVQVDAGTANVSTSVGVDVVVVTQGAGSDTGAEGFFGFLTSHVNALTGTLSNSSGVVAELLCTAGAGAITNYHYFNVNQFGFDGGSVANVYGFYNGMNFSAATSFSASFYSVDQGTGANHFSFYAVGGNNYFGGTGANKTSFVNPTAATNILNQNSPSLLFTGQAWVTSPGPASQTVAYSIQNIDGILQFSQTAGPGPSQYPFQFNEQVLFKSVVQFVSSVNVSFQTGNDARVYAVTSVANAAGPLTTYTYTAVSSGSQASPGQNITIAGFVTGANNGKFVVQTATLSTVTVYNSSGVAETHAATATLDSNFNSPNVGQYSAQLGLTSSAVFPILGTTYLPNNVFESYPNAPLFVATQKGNATDAAYQRILNDGSTGNHGLEIGAIVDGSGTATVSLQLGHFNSASCAVFNVPVTVKGATPTGTTGQLSFGNTSGFGSGTPATAVTTTTKGAGSGPTTPQTVVNYLQIDIAGTKYWIPLVQ